MNRRAFGMAAAALLVVVGGGAWRAAVVRAQSQRRQARVGGLLHDGRAAEALALLQQSRTGGDAAQKIAALADLGDTAGLTSLWRLSPAAFARNERAALLAARGLIQARDTAAAERIAADWKGRSAHPAWWFALSIDRTLAQRKPDAARRALETARFSGADDAARLTRLALLCDNETPTGLKRAWSYLEQALRVAPKDPEVRAFRGQILERLGKFGAARVEYVAAHVAAPHSAHHADQLAEFYRRRGRLDLAVQTWTLAQISSPSDLLAVRAAFWSQVGAPAPTAALPPVPPGTLQPLARHLRAVAADRFFDADEFDAMPEAAEYARTRPEVLWLQVAEALRTGKEDRALNLLRERATGGEDALAQTLTTVIARRRGAAARLTLPATRERHPLQDALARPTTSPDTARLLARPEAYAAAFLAHGWWGAAVRLMPAGDAAGLPDWYAFGMTEALRTCRGPQAALDWATRQSAPSPALRLTIAELRIAGGDAAGIDGLKALTSAPGPAGDRAAVLLTLARLQQRDASGAEALLRTRPTLASTVPGAELSARAALLRGDLARASTLYRRIADESLEADLFLARTAFGQRRWDEAERWTRIALDRDPDQLELRENLYRIRDARQKGRA